MSDPGMAERMVEVLKKTGSERALVFYGHDGLDELSTTAAADVWEVTRGEVVQHRIDPCATFGLPRATLDDLRGSDAADNAAMPSPTPAAVAQ